MHAPEPWTVHAFMFVLWTEKSDKSTAAMYSIICQQDVELISSVSSEASGPTDAQTSL